MSPCARTDVAGVDGTVAPMESLCECKDDDIVMTDREETLPWLRSFMLELGTDGSAPAGGGFKGDTPLTLARPGMSSMTSDTGLLRAVEILESWSCNSRTRPSWRAFSACRLSMASFVFCKSTRKSPITDLWRSSS